MKRNLPSTAQAKGEARALRAELDERGTAISHAEALETIARRYGFRNWNTFRAEIDGLAPRGRSVGDRVTGRYLSQPFVATVLAADEVRPGWFRLVLDLDAAVDVVRFDSFSNLRKQIRAEIGPAGHSRERTSDGAPHVELDP